MSTKWVFSSTFLPYTGEPIDFLLEDRETPISGTFADGVFHSRWADFSTDQVQSWREAVVDPTQAPNTAPLAAERRAWPIVLMRLARRILPIQERRGGVAPTDGPVGTRKIALPARPAGALVRTGRKYPDSNQTAS